MFDLFDFVERTQNSFDIVADDGNNVQATFDFVEATLVFVERIDVRLAAFDNVASTLLLVWTRLYTEEETSELLESNHGNLLVAVTRFLYSWHITYGGQSVYTGRSVVTVCPLTATGLGKCKPDELQ